MIRSPGTAAAAALVVALGTAGCAARAAAQGPQIQADDAYVPLPVIPGLTTAYLALRNNGAADSLVAASTSLGGRVVFRAPGAAGAMRSVPALAVPAHSVLRLVPDGPHLEIIGARRMHNGRAFTIMLDFRHAGELAVTAVITNPQSGNNNSYLFD